MDNRLDIPANAVWVKLADSWIGDIPKQGSRVELTHEMSVWNQQATVIQRSRYSRAVQVVPDEDINSPANWRVTQ